MNRPGAWIGGGLAGLGGLILAGSVYLAVAYGRGDAEAGNFNRCWYAVARDAATGRPVRSWGVRGESTEDTWLDRVDMWAVGLLLVTVGGAVGVTERALRGPRDRF